MTFIELSQFTSAIVDLLDDRDYALFQTSLLLNPKAGKVIQNSGGLRKVRMRLPGRGKSGGARVIYPRRNRKCHRFVLRLHKSEK